jgi:hypothetical protein
MAAKTITTSTNISVLDSKIIANLCSGQFTIDATPSVFIGGGASNILGYKVKITNPYGVVIKDFGTSYDFDGVSAQNYTTNIPTQGGKIQYGNYTIELQVTDADSTTYSVTKSVNVCTYNSDTNPCDDRVTMTANCKNGKLNIAVSDPPTFKGVYFQSVVQSWTLSYPPASGVASLTTTYGRFSVQLYEGMYRLTGTVCATYNMGDNVYLSLGYTGIFEKNVKCNIDYSCVYPRLAQLNEKLNADCSEAEKNETSSIILQSLWLLKAAEIANDAGEDNTVFLVDLEKLLGCQCRCDCSALPVLNGSPSTNVLIEGCNVASEEVGLTTVYTINNYSYLLTVDEEQNLLTVSNPSLNDCVYSQQVAFNIANAYTAIKNLISDSTEYNFWASIINNTLATIDATCLGVTVEQWAALTFAEKFALVVATLCEGAQCTGAISDVETVTNGNADSPAAIFANVLISWTETSPVSFVQVFVDGVLQGTVLGGVEELELLGMADFVEHTYTLIPVCSNGALGEAVSAKFIEIGCPSISPPVVSSNNVNGVECPYDLTGLESTPPLGITIEWHTANNTSASSLIADPTNVSSGVYYAFAKNTEGCYSTATQVILICDGETSCTAPQGVTVNRPDYSVFVWVMFSSAAFPPPGDSYTVKRKLAGDPDVDGSYTTLGSPTWFPASSKWVYLDNTTSDNISYTYKIQSNCGDSPATTPYVLYNFSYIQCVTSFAELTSGPDTIFFGFADQGGDIDKYEVSLYNASGNTLLETITFTPAFDAVVTGTFYYLEPDTAYKIAVKSFIGTKSNSCAKTDISTTPA